MKDVTIKDYEAKAIKDIMRTAKAQIKELETQLKRKYAVVADCQNELDRRTIATYWESHPEQMRLEVGYKVAITEEFQQLKINQLGYKEAALWFDSDWAIGAIHDIRDVSPITNTGHIERDMGVTSCPYSVMVGMRRAYLQQQESKP